MLLAEGRRAVTISSTLPFIATDATGATFKLPKGALTLARRSPAPVRSRPVRPCSRSSCGPAKKGLLALDGRLYRGKLELVPQGEFLRVVNVARARELPPGRRRGRGAVQLAGRGTEGPGRRGPLVRAREPRQGQAVRPLLGRAQPGVPRRRRREAVDDAGGDATAGEVVLYGGKVATTYYFSTSGGKTASAADVFGFDVPYLVSRPDPWDKLSPYHRWGPVLLGARTVQSKLGIDARVVDATGTATPSGRLRALVVRTTSGAGVAGVARPYGARPALDVDLGRRAPARPATADSIVFGSTTRLSGVGRGLGAPRLASSPDGSAWTPAGTVTPDAVGAISVDVKPRTDDALPTRGRGREPRRRFSSRSRRASRWLGRPRWSRRSSPGPYARDSPERSSRWSGARARRGSPSARPRSTEPERFRLELDTLVPAGSYRARVSAAAGFAAGTSAVVQVSG